MQARQEEQDEFGDKVDMNQTAKETLKIFHDKQEMDRFLESDQVGQKENRSLKTFTCFIFSQAKFWQAKGYKFDKLTVEQCQEIEPVLAGADSTHGVVNNQGDNNEDDDRNKVELNLSLQVWWVVCCVGEDWTLVEMFTCTRVTQHVWHVILEWTSGKYRVSKNNAAFPS